MKSGQSKSSATLGQSLESILINKTRVFLHFENQTSNLGKDFRYLGIRKNLQIPSKWIDKTEHWHWIYSFKYLEGGLFEVEIDYNDKFVRLSKV